MTALAPLTTQFAEKLRTSHNPPNTIKSTLPLLMGRYYLQRSQLDVLIDWYGKKTWLEKLAMGFLFIGGGALIGAIVHLTVLFAALASCVYLSVHFFLMEAFNTKMARENRLAEDIVAKEENIERTVTTFNGHIKTLHALNDSTSNLNAQFAGYNQQFEELINPFVTDTATYTRIAHDLEATTTRLAATIDIIKTTFNDTDLKLHAAITTMNEQAAELNANVNQLESTNAALLMRNTELMTINQAFQANLGFFTRCEELQTILESRVAEDEIISKQVRASAGKTIALNVGVGKTIEKSLNLRADIKQQQRAFSLFSSARLADIDADSAQSERVRSLLASMKQKESRQSINHD